MARVRALYIAILAPTGDPAAYVHALSNVGRQRPF